MYRAEFLKDLNAERAQRHLAPLTEDSRYDQIAQQRSQQLLTNFDHGEATSDFIAADLFAQQGVPGLYGECISMDYLDDDQANPSQNVADKNIYSYIYDDADSDWGHRDILLDATTTTIGIGATQEPGSEYVYGAINTGHA
ncbi:CAP domain-containing protein [Levilactobacillus spicheri]